MTSPVLATKLFIPPLRRDLVLRQRLIDQLNVGVQQKLTLISAPAGFGKSRPCSCIPHNTLIIQTVGPFMLFLVKTFLIGNFCERLYTQLSE